MPDASIAELREAAIYREMVQSALRHLADRNQRIKTLERDLAAKVEEIRRYVAMQMEGAEDTP